MQSPRDRVAVPAARYIYRVTHRIMEGDCQWDHGPRVAETPPLWVDRTPVTNRMYAQYLQESGYKPQDSANYLRHWQGGGCPPELDEHPVVWVSLVDAMEYAGFYGLRLPTDEEWQYIAAGPEALMWPWGNEYDRTRCNCQKDTTPVTAFPLGAGPFGTLDMCGNTWEWTAPAIEDGHHRFALLRGGCGFAAPHFWHAEGGPHPNNSHLKMPLLNEALNRCATVGFRCVEVKP